MIKFDTKKQMIVIQAGFRLPTGYSQYARVFSQNFIKVYKDKYNIILLDLSGDATQQVKLPEYLEDYVMVAGNFQAEQRLNSDVFALIAVGLPTQVGNLNRNVIKHVILLTASIQSDPAETSWIPLINNLDLCLTMSQFSVDVLQHAQTESVKLNTPIRIVNHCIDNKIDSKPGDLSKMIDDIDQDFCFLGFGQWLPGSLGNDRKDMGSLVKCFLQTFKDMNGHKMPALILKTHTDFYSKVGEYQIKQKIKTIRDSISIDKKMIWPNIYLLYGSVSENQISELFDNQKIKCMVSFTHGQGWGIPLIDFQYRTTKPVLFSNWSGNTEYQLPEYISQFGLRGNLTQIPGELQQYYYGLMNPLSKWFTVDYDYAKNKMLQVFYGHDQYTNLCKNQQDHIISNFNYKVMQNQIKSVFQGIL